MIVQESHFRLWGAPVVALALALSVSTAAAQDIEAARCEDDAPYETLRGDVGDYPTNSCAPRQSPFQLFGSADFAGSGMRSAAPDVQYWTTNSGLSDSGKELQGVTLPFGVIGVEEGGPTNVCYQDFELQFWAAAGRSDWLRNRELAPSLQNVTGGGWTYLMNTHRLAGWNQWSGKDGTLGLWHSGVQSEVGAGCRDHGDSYWEYPEGFPLLAGSDCPETWGSAGWQGRRWVGPLENWVEYFNAVGSDEFTFDFWRVPEGYWSDKEFIGDFQTFGAMTDHGRDQLEWYGNATPFGSGDPTLEGYPIGLNVYFNAYSFKIPALSRGFIWEGLIVNESEEVYGVPLDYDSLWFGILIRPLRDNGGGRRANPHAISELGAVVHNELGRTPDCDGAIEVPQSIGCSSPRGRTPGFTGGAQGHIIFKSPIGDLRNKHFSDPASPFYAPDHPNAGDTITFNRFSMCSYRCAIQQFIFDARKGYGILAAKAADALDGRDSRELVPFVRWELFHQYYAPDGSERYCDPTNPTEPGCFGYRVPGDWTYSNRPPGAGVGPDTLWFDNCRPPTDVTHPGANQCTGLWADTLPDKTLNWTQNVVWPGAGPFPLAAGDTAPFVTVTFAAADSATLMNSLESFYKFYMYDFYLGPGLPTPPNVASVVTTSGSARLGETDVTLFLDNAAEEWRDAFALKTVNDLRDPAPGSIWENIVSADPAAADNLEAVINRNNVDTVFVYKSCDNARTFTADATSWECDPSPARDMAGNAVGTGWEAYAVLTAEDGVYQTTWSDGQVAPGHSYLYSLVAHTPGIHLETLYWADTDEDGIVDTIRDTTVTIVPEGLSVLTANPADPFAAEVYIPASEQAGSRLPAATLLSFTGPVPFAQFGINLQRNAETEGTYRLVFGSDAIVNEYRRSGRQQVDSTVVLLEQSVLARMPDGSLEDLVSDTVVYRSMLAAGLVLGTVDATETTSTTVGDVEVTTTDMNAKTGILLNAVSGDPLFASARLVAGQFTPSEFLVHPAYPQFVVDLDDEPGEYVTDHWAIWNADSLFWDDLRGRSDPSVGWLQGQSESTDLQWGYYFVDWGTRIFDELPVVDVYDPLSTIQHYQDVLDRRQAVTRTEVNEEVLAAVQSDIDATLALEDLIEVEVPFTVSNLAFGPEVVNGVQGATVRIAMLADSKRESVLLGRAPDSVTAPVPTDVWVPGEPLIFLEDVEFALTNPDGTLQRDGTGQPVFDSELRATWSAAMVGCDEPRTTCNPVSGPSLAADPGYVHVRPNGAPGYEDGWDLLVMYKNPFTSGSSFEFAVSAMQVGSSVTSVTQEALDRVRVVPNPYIGRSAFEYEGAVRRLMFTNLPPRGAIQIFTASGQFIQRITWNPSDLAGNGDLFWNMQTREGNLIASGLYVFVITTNDPETGNRLKKFGKFIVIR